MCFEGFWFRRQLLNVLPVLPEFFLELLKMLFFFLVSLWYLRIVVIIPIVAPLDGPEVACVASAQVLPSSVYQQTLVVHKLN